MPTTGFVPGSLLRLTMDDGAGGSDSIIFHAQEGSINFSRETRDITTKDTGGGGATGWTETTPGTKSVTLSCNGLTRYDNAANQANVIEIAALFDSGSTTVAWTWTTGVTGDPIYSGNGIIISFNETATNNQESTFDFQISGTSAVTFGTVTV